jgi:hypothetical protein
MTFQKKHKFGFTSDNPLEKTPISFRGRIGQKEALKNIPNWQEQVRDFIDTLINQSKLS